MNSENLLLITGEDLFERERELNKIKEKFGELVKGINFVVLDKDNISLLSGEVTTFPFGYSHKLIVIHMTTKGQAEEGTTSKTDWFSEELAEDMVHSLDVNQIVFVGDIKGTTKLYKWISKNGRIIECNKPKSKKDLAPWIVGILRQNHKIISLENANYMLQICGSDKLMLSNEIEKLVDYVGGREEITKQDIEQVGIRTMETIIFDLTDAVGSRNIASALQYLDELIMQKEPLQKILIMMARHFKSLLITKLCMQNNGNIGEELNTKFPFIINKYKDQARRFERRELEDILIRLACLDADAKAGKIEARTGLEICLIQSI